MSLRLRADVSRSADISALVRKMEQAFGPVEILINNAGIGYFGPTHEASEENWDLVLDTNLKAVFLLSKAVAPGMMRLQPRPYHQYSVARGQERVRGRRHLLRLEMGIARAHAMHGGRFAAARNSRERDLPGKRQHGILAARRKRSAEDAAAGRRCACG